MFNCKTVQASPFWRRLAFFFAMTGIKIVQIFFCTVASKRATFAPKRGMGEGGFFPPQRNRMGTNYGNRRSSGGGAAVPIAVFPKNRGLVPMSVPILFPLCSHPRSHQPKNGRCKKAHNKSHFSVYEQLIGNKVSSLLIKKEYRERIGRKNVLTFVPIPCSQECTQTM